MNRTRGLRILMATALLLSIGCGESPTLKVSGILVGHDAAPMPLAHVHLLRPIDLMFGTEQLIASDEVDDDGRFEVTTAESGTFYLQFTGVNHASKQLPVVVEGPKELELEVRLAPLEYVDDFGGVKAIGDFNEFEASSAREMSEQPDGSFVVEIETDATTSAYQLTGVVEPGFRFAGTDFDSCFHAGVGDYRSVVRADGGTITIRFDPAKLPQSKDPASVTFDDPSTTPARMASFVEELEERIAEWAEAREEVTLAGEELSYDWTSTLEDLRTRAEGEEDPLIRQALYYGILQLNSYGADLDSASARLALDGLPPTSHLWSLQPFGLYWVLADAFESLKGERGSSSESDTVRPVWLEDYVTYMEDGAAAHPDEDVRATMLMGVVWIAHTAKDANLGRVYHERLIAEYPESPAADWAREYAPDRNIQVGKSIPEFAFVSLDDSTASVSSHSLSGSVYLMDFWATWCVPCIAELPNLHELYETYGGRGFEIVSFSFDEAPDAVTEFRQEDWEMPWIHVHVPDAWENEAIHPFEVFGIPKVILVGTDGVILGTDDDVKGERLRETLARVLGEP